MELPPETPSTAHVTLAAELPPPETVAVKICAPPVARVAVAGEMDTITPEVVAEAPAPFEVTPHPAVAHPTKHRVAAKIT
jgi:hypothetical protein